MISGEARKMRRFGLNCYRRYVGLDLRLVEVVRRGQIAPGHLRPKLRRDYILLRNDLGNALTGARWVAGELSGDDLCFYQARCAAIDSQHLKDIFGGEA